MAKKDNRTVSRDGYLRRLIELEGTDMIKVITGIRRCGKTVLLLRIFVDHLRSEGVDDAHILRYPMEALGFDGLYDPKSLFDDIRSKIADDSQYYVLIDEIQYVHDFHKVLLALHHMDNVDVYVTGSNSHLLSKDIITEMRGRSIELRVRPFSFAEFCDAKGTDPYLAIGEYFDYGGLPELLQFDSHETKVAYLVGLFDTIYVRDVADRHRVRRPKELANVTEALTSSIGSLTNVKRLADTLSAAWGSKITRATVSRYIGCLCDSFLFERARRYDITGRKAFDSQSKYFIADHGLKNAKEGFRHSERTHIMENMIYNELRSRGFDVDIGVVESSTFDIETGESLSRLEVDFVARKLDRKYYIQSSYAAGEGNIEREVRPFGRIRDSFPRVVIVNDRQQPRMDENGILFVGLVEFLLDEDVL